MKNLHCLLKNKRITYKELLQIKSSYVGHLGKGDTRKLIGNTLNMNTNNKELEMIEVKIENNNIIYK